MKTEKPYPNLFPEHPSSTAADQPQEDALWNFVPLADYRVPSLPVHSAAATIWTSVKRIFMRSDQETRAPVKQEAELHTPSQMKLERLMQPLDWTEAVTALDVSLNDWAQSSTPDRPVKFVIGQPHNGHIEILRHWAARHEATLISAPAYKQIIDENRHWFDCWPASSDRPWVLPNLEQCYLRHAHGLTLVRQLLEKAENGELGRGVIGCNSWSWAYLQHVWPVPRPDALSLQAFDAPRLARLFTAMVAARSRKRIRFRNAATGKDILTVPPADDFEEGSDIVKLAAHCRGNVGTAVWFWREQLRSEPDADKNDPDADENMPEKDEPGEESVWVSATLPEPVLPVETDEDTAFLLHTLLLHGGLPASLLPELLPLSPHRCMALLLRLRNSGVVKCRKDRWNVAEPSYMNVRKLLHGRDYLTDGF
ncbi:MAG: hypothetical protein ACU84H_05205 [Gammaproteobacteria bacterium]